MNKIVAEFHYWDYEGYARTAMESRPEINLDELKNIGQEFNVKIEIKKDSPSYFTLTRIGWQSPHYSRFVIQVIGEYDKDVKVCVGKIFLRYGKPDTVPMAFFGERRAGRIIIEDLVSEIKRRKK
ncbi:MAG: hypothetical protein V1915_04500 [Candidatus Bathyarchaeota archaeon]